MKIDRLIEIVRAAVTDRGYDFHCGAGENIGSVVRKYPAAWLVTPVTGAVHGRTEGTVVYSLKLHLMGLPASFSFEQLESDAVAIAQSILSASEILSTSGSRGLSILPARGSLTSHDELSMTLTGDISMWFYL
jgi:hypothetical protein